MHIGCFTIVIGRTVICILSFPNVLMWIYAIYDLFNSNQLRLASVSPQCQCWLRQLMFQDQTKQTVFEYVLVCVMLFTHLQEMSQTRVCENRLPDSLRGVFSLNITVLVLSGMC